MESRPPYTPKAETRNSKPGGKLEDAVSILFSGIVWFPTASKRELCTLDSGSLGAKEETLLTMLKYHNPALTS